MSEHVLVQLASIVILGIGAQWLAWRLRLPSILFLLLFGFIAGPVTGFINPDKLMGDMLFPFVSISVAIILFEGGLTLQFREFKQIGKIVTSLVTVGVLVTWAMGAVAAHYILSLNWSIAVLLGAILVVTGPTVIGPLLNHIRPKGRVAHILKWEGIVIDPIGALLAVLVFEAILIGSLGEAWTVVLLGIIKTAVFGGLAGAGFAWLLLFFLKRYWIPDFLQETVTLTLVIAAYVFADLFQEESGLFAATIMGLVMDNQRVVTVKHIVVFKENLRVLIISALFILLSARLSPETVQFIQWPAVVFLLLLIIIVRPLAVYMSTLKAGLEWRDRIFLSWMAPRGIVAASVASIFAIRLGETTMAQAELLVPMTFWVIIGTVVFYSLTAPVAARKLEVAQSNPQGVLLVGAHRWAVAVAEKLKELKFKAAVVDTNWDNIRTARMAGINAYFGSALSRQVSDSIELEGIGKLLAVTPNDEANSLAVLHFSDIFSSEELYQLSPRREGKGEEEAYSPQHLRGRFLFGSGVTFNYLYQHFLSGAQIKSTVLTTEFNFDAFKTHYGENAVPLFLVTEQKQLHIFSKDKPLNPKPGQTLVAMVYEQK